MSNRSHIAEWSRESAVLGVEERLAWAATVFHGKLVFASALGAEDQVITDVIARRRLAIPIVTLDTGRLFSETYSLIQETEARYGIRIRVLFPERAAVEAMVEQHGVNLFRDSVEKRKLCCRVRKIEPLRRALAGYEAWVCGLRREQSVTRSDVDPVVWDEANQKAKINPLAEWKETQVWDYLKRHGVPFNRLQEHGFPSIGCACCTRAVAQGEGVRAGRWWWEQPEQKECGLHWVDGKPVPGCRRGCWEDERG